MLLVDSVIDKAMARTHVAISRTYRGAAGDLELPDVRRAHSGVRVPVDVAAEF